MFAFPIRFMPLLLFSSILFQSGCFALYRTKQIDVLIRDAETGKPIEGAKLGVNYLRPPLLYDPAGAFTVNFPESQKELSDSLGCVQIRSSTYQGSFFSRQSWSVDAEEYVTISTYWAVDSDRIEERKNPFVPNCFSKAKKEGFDAVIDLWKNPPPKYQVVIPSDYQGPVFIETVEVSRDAKTEVGKRVFQFPINRAGYAKVNLYRGSFTHDFPNIEYVNEKKESLQSDSLDFDNSQLDEKESFFDIDFQLYYQGPAMEAKALHEMVYDYRENNPRSVSRNEDGYRKLLNLSKNGLHEELKKEIRKRDIRFAYQNDILTILHSKNANDVDKAYQNLQSGDLSAISQMVKFFDDNRVPKLDHSKLSVSKPPTLGLVCYGIVQRMIEEKPMKSGFYNVLYPNNIEQWLSERKEKSLRGLKVDAAQQSLLKATKHWEDSNSELAKANIQFYKEVLRKLKSEEN